MVDLSKYKKPSVCGLDVQPAVTSALLSMKLIHHFPCWCIVRDLQRISETLNGELLLSYLHTRIVLSNSVLCLFQALWIIRSFCFPLIPNNVLQMGRHWLRLCSFSNENGTQCSQEIVLYSLLCEHLSYTQCHFIKTQAILCFYKGK